MTAQRASEQLGTVPVKYAQVTSILSRRGHTAVADYQPIFGLSNDETRDLLEYADLYSVLRQCCGAEASTSWREYLQRRSPKVGGDKSSAEHRCHMYDLDAVERAIMRTRIYLRFGHTNPVGAPWQLGVLNGRRCTSLNKVLANSTCRATMHCS